MIKQGILNNLRIERFTPPGAFLSDGDDNEVLLPNKYVPTEVKIGEWIEVFVYSDSEDRLVATTLTPNVMLHEFACLKVKEVNNVGAFLDWGLEKDLLVPFREQGQRMKPGNWYLIYMYHDDVTNRLAATTKVHPYFENDAIDLEEQQEVDLLIAEQTEQGLNVVVNNRFRGLIYLNELFTDPIIGERMKGYVKRIRPDNKLDISLQKSGLEHLESSSLNILKELEENEGFLALHDRSDPDEIQTQLQMSKKSFKRAVGILYKQKRITIEPEGIRLIPEEPGE